MRPFKVFSSIMGKILQTTFLVRERCFHIQVSILNPKERSEKRHIFDCSSIQFGICVAYTLWDKSHTPIIQIFSLML